MITTEGFIERARAKHGDRFDYHVSRYVGFQKPIEVVCRAHGLCLTTPKSHLHSKSGGCPKCRDKLIRCAIRKTTAEFIEHAREIHGNRYDYRLVDYTGTRSPVIIVCPQHGPFHMKPERH